MADIIELEIVAKATGLKPMVSTVERLERQLVRATKALDQNKISQDRYNKIILSTKQQYVGLGNSLEKANSEVNKFTSATAASLLVQKKELDISNQMAVARRQANAANARHTAETKQKNAVAAQAIATEERLKNKFVQGYAAMDIYTKELRDLSMAHKAGIISTEQHSSSLNRLNTQMANGTGAFASYGSGVAGATQKQSKLGVVAQQSGYQVGDFLVQIQSGANPMMAFGQQATQLVGVMSLFGGKMLFAGAALGIIIPLVTAIAGSMLRSGKATKSFSEALDEATSSLDEYISLASKVDDTISESFDSATDSINATSEAYQDLIMLAKIDAFNNIVSLNDSLIKSARSSRMMKGELEEVMLLLSATPEQGTSMWFVGAVKEAEEFSDLLDNLDNADGLQNRYIAATALKEAFIAMVGPIDDQTDAQQEFTGALSNSLYTMELMGAATGEETDAQKALREAEEERVRGLEFMNRLKEIGLGLTFDQTEAERQDLATAESMLATMVAENELQQEINDHGKDSVEVAEMRAAQERKVYAAMVEQLQVLPEMKSDIMDAYDASVDLAAGLDNVGDRARDAANGVMSILGALRATLRELDAQEAGLAAAQRVIKSGGSEIDAKVTQAGFEFEASASAKGLEGPELQSAVAQEMANERRRLQNQQLESTMYDVFNTGGSSGSGSSSNSSSDKPDFVEALEAEMVVRGELVKLYGDEYELQTEIARIVKGLGEDSGDYDAQHIAALAQQNILLKEQEVLRDESAAQMENIYNMLGDEMGTAFTSMIDGTKSVEDAFKSMAKNIIDQLIQIFIVEQMVNSISGGLGSLFGGGGGSSMQGLTPNPHTASGFNANGNVFSGGSQVQAYANGGIVNSPTMFPMNGNKTGLMGEDGPEAIMPLKRGANGKLGVQAEGSGKGGDNVVIHQNFNFQANGDDSVKKLIQQAAPQIAQMTKSSMLNDRRRGGQTKAVFG
jgi:hypothetical protein